MWMVPGPVLPTTGISHRRPHGLLLSPSANRGDALDCPWPAEFFSPALGCPLGLVPLCGTVGVTGIRVTGQELEYLFLLTASMSCTSLNCQESPLGVTVGYTGVGLDPLAQES